jgi:hypothetical protein
MDAPPPAPVSRLAWAAVHAEVGSDAVSAGIRVKSVWNPWPNGSRTGTLGRAWDSNPASPPVRQRRGAR